jgi:hypothetical protein
VGQEGEVEILRCAQDDRHSRQAVAYATKAICDGELEDWEEKVLGVSAPALNGLWADQSGSVALGFVAHEKRIAVSEVGRDFAVIGEGDVGAVFAKLDAVAIVFETMRKQTSAEILASRNCGEQHGLPPQGNQRGYLTKWGRREVRGKSVEKCGRISGGNDAAEE